MSSFIRTLIKKKKSLVCFTCGYLHTKLAEFNSLKKTICPTELKTVTIWYFTDLSFLRAESIVANTEVFQKRSNFWVAAVVHSVISDCNPADCSTLRLPCLSPSPGVCSNSCPLNPCCHPTISSSVAPFSCPQPFPASGSFPICR